MFGFGKPSNSGNPMDSYARRSSKDSSYSPRSTQPFSPSESFEAAIDGPPSPERIRAYTEQMRRSSIFGNNSRTHTFSSASSSFRSGDSSGASTDNLSLSRKSSVRSNSSSMLQGEKVDVAQRFGKTLFSRSGRKMRRESTYHVLTNSMSSLTVGLGLNEDGSTKERSSGKGNGRPGTSEGNKSRKNSLQISAPSNFQHVTHTRQDHLPNLDRTSRTELMSEFTAIRASQAPTMGELKGISAQDLHFENFSFEAINENDGRSFRPISQRRPSDLRNSVSPTQPQRTRSHDMLRSIGSAPPRPPRSPTYPPELPARTSSRTASTLVDGYDNLATPSLERPPTTNGFRKPAPYVPTSPPPTWTEQQSYFSDRPVSHAVTTPGDEAWPLTASTTDGSYLDDVPEEEEVMANRRSRMSIASGDLRLTKSVPAFSLAGHEQPYDRPETGMSMTIGRAFGRILPEAQPSPISPDFRLNHASWEDDIDYCYEHEAEADCDYQWDRCSLDLNRPQEDPSQSVHTPEPELDFHLQKSSDRVYTGRFRPSLLVPSAYDIPELSPMSNASAPESDPRTPAFMRPAHLRSPSHASSFKESHGFNLSPSLLIPADFAAQMDQDNLYNSFNSGKDGDCLFPPDYSLASPVDEPTSSTASYRSSNFSRGSARSSSSTRLSATNSRASQESMLLLNAGSVSQAHRSVGSSSSLPDLIPSGPRKRGSNVSLKVAGMALAANIAERDDSAPAPEVPGPASGSSLQMRRKTSLAEQGMRRGSAGTLRNPDLLDYFPAPVQGIDGLSPVAESFPLSPKSTAPPIPPQAHGRKASAPITSHYTKEFKGRARSATTIPGHGKTKSRGSYMLFPSTSAS